jgi:hypothetical protein
MNYVMQLWKNKLEATHCQTAQAGFTKNQSRRLTARLANG